MAHTAVPSSSTWRSFFFLKALLAPSPCACLPCSYEYVTFVGANDMYDGLTTSAGMFVEYTIARFEEVKQLHIILLVISLVLILGFVLKMFR